MFITLGKKSYFLPPVGLGLNDKNLGMPVTLNVSYLDSKAATLSTIYDLIKFLEPWRHTPKKVGSGSTSNALL